MCPKSRIKAVGNLHAGFSNLGFFDYEYFFD